MSIHHLSCATLCPRGAKLLGGEGGVLALHEMCAHVLLIEASDCLVLIDTGFGTGDVADPGRLGQPFRFVVGPRPRLAETAVERVKALGLDPGDVRHIAVTHLDLDHAGGLADFPEAEIHLFRPEMEAALNPSLRERARYIPGHWEHGPNWRPQDVDGDEWMGFEAVNVVPGLDPAVLIVPLPGHSRGHSAVAVREGDRWLLHCGDAYFHPGEVATPPSCPVGLRIFQGIVGYDGKTRRANQERLRELASTHADDVRLFCAHDVSELRALQAAP